MLNLFTGDFTATIGTNCIIDIPPGFKLLKSVLSKKTADNCLNIEHFNRFI